MSERLRIERIDPIIPINHSVKPRADRGRRRTSMNLCRRLHALGLLVVLALFVYVGPAAALNRCDVAPLGAPDGIKDAADAMVILRGAVNLIDPAMLPMERADVAPIQVLGGGVVRPLGDDSISAIDALVCLRIGIADLSFPPNLIMAIEAINPTRPPVDGMGTAQVRVSNDGDGDAAAGPTISLRRNAPLPGPPGPTDGSGMVGVSLAPGADVVVDVDFAAGPVVGPADLYGLVEAAYDEIDPNDNSAQLAFEVNGPPSADAGADQPGVVEGMQVDLLGSGDDPNMDALSYEWQQVSGPAVVINGAMTQTPSFIAPDIAVESDVVLGLTTTDPDGLMSAQDEVTVGIVPINDPPVVMTSSMPADPDEGDLITLIGVVSDPNDDPLMTQWTQTMGPAVMLDLSNPLMPTFTVPGINVPTVFEFNLAATDDEMAMSASMVQFTAQPVNETPIAVADAPPSVLETTLVDLTGSDSSDGDMDPLSYLWTQTAGPPVLIANADQPNASFTAPETASVVTLSFELEVSDPALASAVAGVDVEVEPDPFHPAAIDVRVHPGGAVVGNAEAIPVEIEVLARDPERLVPDGTLVNVSTSLGSFEGGVPIPASAGAGAAEGAANVMATTMAGLVGLSFVPGLVAGQAIIDAQAVGTSAAGQGVATVKSSANAAGSVKLVLDPPAIAAGSTDPVRAIAYVFPANENTGNIADATNVTFMANAGSFPGGAIVGTSAGIALALLDPPLAAGDVDVTATVGGLTANAVLQVVADASQAARVRLFADPATVVGGDAGTPVTAILEPVVPGAVLGASAPTFLSRKGTVDGADITAPASTPLDPDVDLFPFGDYPTAPDVDSDGDGILDPPGAREATVTYRRIRSVDAPELGYVKVGPGDAFLSVLLLPDAESPASLEVSAAKRSLVGGGAALPVAADVAKLDGMPVVDGTTVDFTASAGTTTPASDTTVGGNAGSDVAHPDAVTIAKRIRAHAGIGPVGDHLTLAVVPGPLSPAEISLALVPPILGVGEDDAGVAQATVTRTGGVAVPDGTRVVFYGNAAIPDGTIVPTVGGVAEVSLDAPLAVGEFEVRARIAGTPIEALARGSAAERQRVNALVNLTSGANLSSLTVDFLFPPSALLVSPPGDSYCPAQCPGSLVAGAFVLGGPGVGEPNMTRIAVITFVPFSAPGFLYWVTVDLPPGASADCSAFSLTNVKASDALGMPVAATVACDSVVPAP